MTVSSQVQLAMNNVQGVIQGNFGVYQAAADGTAVVDTRDVPALLVAGCTYISKRSGNYTTHVAPAVASAAVFVASHTLSNGTLTIAAQPDVMRQAQLVVTSASPGPTAGTVAITYIGNDGVVTTDTLSLITHGATPTTQTLSKGAQSIAGGNIAGLVGGTAPVWLQLGSTGAISVPVDPGTQDVVFTSEGTDGGAEAIGTVVAGVLGTITPTTALNATHTYSFGYTFVSPNS